MFLGVFFTPFIWCICCANTLAASCAHCDISFHLAEVPEVDTNKLAFACESSQRRGPICLGCFSECRRCGLLVALEASKPLVALGNSATNAPLRGFRRQSHGRLHETSAPYELWTNDWEKKHLPSTKVLSEQRFGRCAPTLSACMKKKPRREPRFMCEHPQSKPGRRPFSFFI